MAIKSALKWSAAGVVVIAAAALFVTLLPSNAETKLIPRKLLFGNPEKTSPSLSPDGKWMAYLAPDAKNVLNVWVQPTDDSKPATQITSDKSRGIRQFFWQFDNQHLLYLQDVEGNEDWHIFQTNLNTRITRDLTPFSGTRADLTDYISSHPNTLLVQMNLPDRSRFDIYRIDLTTGGIVLDTTNPDQALSLVADNDLIVRAAQSYSDNGHTVIRVRDNADAPWRELLRWGPEETLGAIAGFSPDNHSIYLLTSLDNNTGRLVEVDLATGKRTVIASDSTYDLGSIIDDPKTHALQAYGVDRDKHHWVAIDPKLEHDFKAIEKELGSTFQIISRTLEGDRWIVAKVSDAKPPEFYLYDRPKQDFKFLFSTRPQLAPYQLSAMKPIEFKASDGMTLHGYLTLPAGKSAKAQPMILLVHGGPWVRDRWGFDPQVQWLANRGYAVLQLNYRGSTGYGKAYLHAGNREWGRKMQQDLIDAKQWAIDQGYADLRKVAIYGGSYGGYATLAALAFTPREFCCGVDIVGPSNLLTLLQTIPPYWSPAKAQFDRAIGDLNKDAALLQERSPFFKADQIERPLLIAQGANDPRVKQAESDQIVSAMRKHNRSVDYLLFPDEGHGFARPENRLKFYAAAESFLNKQLGGRQEAPAPDEAWDALKK